MYCRHCTAAGVASSATGTLNAQATRRRCTRRARRREAQPSSHASQSCYSLTSTHMRSRSRSPPLGSDVGGAGLARARREKRASSRQTAARAVTRTPRSEFLSVGSPARPPPRTSRSEFPTTSTQRPTDTTNANAAATTTTTTPGPLPSAAESPTATYRPTARRAMRAASPLSPLKS